MGSSDMSQNQNGISGRFSSRNSSQKISIELSPRVLSGHHRRDRDLRVPRPGPDRGEDRRRRRHPADGAAHLQRPRDLLGVHHAGAVEETWSGDCKLQIWQKKNVNLVKQQLPGLACCC